MIIISKSYFYYPLSICYNQLSYRLHELWILVLCLIGFYLLLKGACLNSFRLVFSNAVILLCFSIRFLLLVYRNFMLICGSWLIHRYRLIRARHLWLFRDFQFIWVNGSQARPRNLYLHIKDNCIEKLMRISSPYYVGI